MAAICHASKSSRYSVTLLALCIAFFYVDRNLLTKKRTGNLEAPRDEKYNQLSDGIWISTRKNTESKTTLPWKTNSSFSSAPLNR